MEKFAKTFKNAFLMEIKYKKRGRKAPLNYFLKPNSLMIARYLKISFFIR